MSWQSGDAKLIIFGSRPEFFDAEASGAKPNTVRLMSTAKAARALFAERITITCEGEARNLDAPLTNVCTAGEMLGKTLIIFSWHPATAVVTDLRGESS